jgi:3-oxoacyl-(acyl-carrier-protein) synthase
MTRRVVVTGLGVVAPNGNGIDEFESALREGRSGIRANVAMEKSGFGCRVAGVPQGTDELVAAAFEADELLAMNSSQRYCSLAALEAWQDAGFARPERGDDRVDWETGAILGTGIGGMDTVAEKIVPLVNEGRVRRLGSTAVEQAMSSGISARVSGLLALGNQVTTNSSACSTGVEAVSMGADRIRRGQASRMLCGGAEGASHYIWAGFDAMRVLCRSWNEEPEKASRPLSASAGGFVPGAGAGVLVLESLESAEVLGSAINCGGHRGGGSMTAPNPTAVRRCIREALADAGVDAGAVDLVNGHLTATGADPSEVASWSAALGRGPGDFPTLTATKSLIGHTLGAAGAVESVATILMLAGRFAHACRNSEDLHPAIQPFEASIPRAARDLPEAKVAVKAGFGFGDVNACVVYRTWNH